MAKFYPLKVKDIRRETAEAVSISFDIPLQLLAEYQFKQGQYITLKLKLNNEEIRRSYSLCTSPFYEKELRVAVKEVAGGRASVFLNRNLKIGDELEVMTPMGNFYTPLSGSNKKQYVLFAGGSGITPIMSILKSVVYIEKQSTITLIYANKNEDSVIFKKELEKLQEQYASALKIVYVYDEPKEATENYLKGMVTVEKVKTLAEKYIDKKAATEVFICGPGPMMENVKTALEQQQIPKQNIHIEYFSSVIEGGSETKEIGASVKSKVTVLQYGVSTEFDLAGNGMSILEAAIDAGVDAPFSCKGAVCCTCRAKVMEGKARMDANFALTESEVAEGYILTCQAHPLTEKLVIDYDAI